MIWQKFLAYLNFFRRQKTGHGNINLSMMHGINRISILMFLIAVLIIVIRHLL